MTASVEDYNFFFKKVRGKLIGLISTYVNGFITSRSSEFEKETHVTGKEFECKHREYDSFRFAGVYRTKLSDGHILHKKSYIERLKTLNNNSSYQDFRSARAFLCCIQQTGTEITASVNFLFQLTVKQFNKSQIEIFNDIVKLLKQNPSGGSKMKKLDMPSLYIRSYSDSSFSNNLYFSSQLGFIITLSDKINDCHVLYYSSHKSRNFFSIR